MEIQKNKPIEKIKEGRISLLSWENTDEQGQKFISFSLSKTAYKKRIDDPSKFEGQTYNLNGLTKNDLDAIKKLITEMEEKGWSQ